MQNHIPIAEPRPPWLTALAVATALVLLPIGSVQAAKSKIAISQAAWFPKTQQLLVKGANKSASQAVELFDVNGRRLAAASGAKFNFALGADALPAAPCAVRVQAGNDEAIVAVKGAPKTCAKAPTCSITAPSTGSEVTVGQATSFQAQAETKDKKALPMTYEWDFGGGVLGRPTGTLTGTSNSQSVSFVRDHGVYRVRFSATDTLGRRCEDAINVSVGTAPTPAPETAALARESIRTAPKLGSELDGAANDIVVLPFAHSAVMGQGVTNLDAGNPWPGIFHLNATVYQKARLPQNVDLSAYELVYSAAANPADPVGADSINTTSRNYPVDASFKQAQIRKTDMWEAQDGWETAAGYESFWLKDSSIPKVSPLWKDAPTSTKLFNAAFPNMWGEGEEWTWFLARNSVPDEGYLTGKFETRMSGNAADKDNFLGSFMPGKDSPYKANAPQSFLTREADTQAFLALAIPLTDMDDQGRVNANPLLRVQAKDRNTGEVKATTDSTINTAKDVRCSECHVYGGIAADPTVKRLLRPQKKDAQGNPVFDGYGNKVLLVGDSHPREPYAPPFLNSNPKSLEDKEREAFYNQYALHPFIELGKNAEGKYMDDDDPDGDGESNNWENGLRYVKHFKASEPCQWCHQSAYLAECGFATTNWDGLEYGPSEHRFHGRIQVDDQGKVIRDAEGRPLMWDDQATGKTNPNSLFPVLDKAGNKLPMEKNCLRCHVGASQKGYHDPMYSAGLQCSDCHGDMLAVGDVFPKKAQGSQPRNDKGQLVDPNNKDDKGNPKVVHRVDYLDQPDCGSCHTGKGSDAVRKLAYDPADPSATSLLPENPRFAVNIAKIQFNYVDWDMNRVDKSYDLPLFRKGKDSHGNVPCGSCHGAAHAIWPIKDDPSSNENVTALQLQGHTGPILECNVCHTADSFKNEADLDGGVYSGDPVAGILGGPHNMHPINDPYWWKEAPGDSGDATPNKGGKVIGGWHNNYAKKPGAKGEDQCAACHGADHKGTRLSKTPVDREFVNEKGKKVSVAAGTPIACDLCHSMDKSFTGVPGH